MSKDIIFKTLMLKGEQGATIRSIEKIGETGSYDILRITLSDESYVDFEVLNTVDEDKVKVIIAEQTDNALSDESENAVQNKVIKSALDQIGSAINTISGSVEDLSDELEQTQQTLTMWKWLSQATPEDESWTSLPINVTDVFNTAKEFLAVITFQASSGFNLNIDILIPNILHSPQPATQQDYVGGYYYSADYNGSVMCRFNRNAKTISVLKSWTQITGGSSAMIGSFTLYYR